MKSPLFKLLLTLWTALQLTCVVEGSGCQIELNDTAGSLQSPNYPDLYPSNADCTWRLALPSSSQRWSFVFEFASFDTEQGFDIVEIGSLSAGKEQPLFAYTGNKNPGVIFLPNLTSLVYVHFTSDENVERGGFNVTYRLQQEHDELTPYGLKSATSFQVELSGTIRSHDVGTNYSTLSIRQWYFYLPANSVTVFNLTRFETEVAFDQLAATAGSDVSPNAFRQYTFSGTPDPQLFVMRAAMFNLVFFSDISVTGRGFAIDYTTYPQRLQAFTLTGAEGTISTPPLEINQVLRWLIVPPEGCHSIEIDVEQLDLNNATDVFSLGRGDPETGTYYPLSELPSAKVVIPADRAFVEAQVSSHLEFSFKLNYKALTEIVTLPTSSMPTTQSQEGCFTEIRGKSGHLSYSLAASGPDGCTWRIIGFNGLNIKIIFDHLQLAEGDSLAMGLRGQVGEHEVLRIQRDDANHPIVFTLADSVVWLRLNSTGSSTMSLRFHETAELHTVNFKSAERHSLVLNETFPAVAFTMPDGLSQVLWLIDNELQCDLEVTLVNSLLQPLTSDQILVGQGTLYGDDESVVRRNYGVKDGVSSSIVIVPASKAWILLLTDEPTAPRNGTFVVAIRRFRFTMPRLLQEVPRSHLLLSMYSDEQYTNKLANMAAAMENVTVKYDMHFQLSADVSSSFYLEPPTCYYNATGYSPPKRRDLIVEGCPLTSQMARIKGHRANDLTFRFQYQASFYGFEPTQEFELHCEANICDKRKGVQCRVEQC